MKGLRVIIAGGGTGGHIFPAVAVGHALQRLQPDTQLLFVGANGRMEMEKVPQEGFEIKGLDIAGFNRSNLFANITLPYKLIKSRIRAKQIIKQFKPGAIVGVGGYASFPVLYAGQGMGIPTLIQEQNSFAGKSNKILAKLAKVVCVAYEGMDKFFPIGKILLTGNPVRANIARMNISSEAGKGHFGLDKSRQTILVVGGSLGAKSINESIDANLDELMSSDVQLIWQTGKLYYEQAAKRAVSFGDKIRVFEFIKDMDYAYSAADVVISRAGALAIAELCIAAKPVIFVPYPYAAEDHQTNNALALVNKNAAILIKDEDVKTELLGRLNGLLNDKSLQQIMAENLKALAITDADERIAKKVIEIAIA